MNILLLSQFFSTTRGGGEYIFSIIAKKLAENNHKVWIITNKIKDEEYKHQKNIRMIFVPPVLEYKGGLPPGLVDNLRYTFNAFFSGMKIIRNEKIDLIHSNNFSPSIAGSMLSSFTKKPHIITMWDVFTLCGKDYWQRWASQEGVSKIYSFLGARIEKIILKMKHNAIYTISNASKDDLIEFGAKKPIHVILPTIENKVTKNEPLNPFQFIFVGRLVFYKNLEVLIKAISIVKNSEPRIKLVIVGDGPHKKSLENLSNKLGIRTNIEFTGYVTAEEKIRLISSSLAFLFPSLCEGFGLVILEAFSQEKPVIVSDIRPLSDIIQHEKTGFIVNPNDENKWSEYILRLVKNPQESSVMGKNGNNDLKNTYSEEIMYTKISQMYKSILNV